jgi:hypothetical protein
MKKILVISTVILLLASCRISDRKANTSALDEQDHTEQNQRNLNTVQPPPTINWSLERDNLIKRFKLQNDRSVSFYMYVFIEGVGEPIGYYQVNKVSSVNSQLTNPEQIVTYSSPNHGDGWGQHVIPSPAEDGSYGTNGDGVFGFTPEDIYIETNMKYITSTVPLSFTKPVNRLAIINTDEAKKMLDISRTAMGK